jgi:hypothetical protein
VLVSVGVGVLVWVGVGVGGEHILNLTATSSVT